MAELASRNRTTFRIPRVEFDLSGLLLGMVGYLAFRWSWGPLASLLGVAGKLPEKLAKAEPGNVLQQDFGTALTRLQLPGLAQLLERFGWKPALEKVGEKIEVVYLVDHAWWEFLVVGAWLLILWSLIGGGLARIHAYRIARDESVPMFDALGFSLANLRSFLLAPLFVLGAAAFFVLLNVLAGLAVSIPWVGPVLQLVLHPLALLGGAVITVIAIGGVFGLPVMHTALATERNGTLDAISRTYSYLFQRPVLFIGGVLVVLFIGGLLLQFGGWFLGATAGSLAAGTGRFGTAATEQSSLAALAGGLHIGTQMNFPVGAPQLPTALKLTFWVSWFFGFLGATIVRGAVLSYVVGGLTDVYFMLRSDVDGIPESEVFVEGETAELEGPLDDEPLVATDPDNAAAAAEG